MTIFQSIILGLVQGLSEFLPISSSGHLILFHAIFKVDPGLGFDVALHWGTLIGIFMYFRKDLFEMTKGFFGLLSGKRAFENKIPWFLILGTIPAGIIGLILEKHVETIFRSPKVVAINSIIFGLILFIADKIKRNRIKFQALNWVQSMIVGMSQGLAVIPGVSRSGMSISSGLFLGLERDAAVRLSFLLSIPLILGAGLHEMKYFILEMRNPLLYIGILSSALSGYMAVSFLIKFVRTKSFTPFVVYRVLLGFTILFILYSRP